ncbi:MAG: agmatine deiminase family protein, partial [Pseudomonadota bacterium]
MIQEKRLILPEWSQQSSVWVGWPSSAELWGSYLQPARIEIRDLVEELSSRVPVRLVVSGTKAAIAATKMCKKACEIIELPMGDIWLRDTGPNYAHQSEGLVGLRFRFNGWGEKYLIDCEH